MESEHENKLCKKLRYGNPDRPTVILGIVIKDEDGFIDFQTGKTKITISKRSLISLEDTNEVFRDGSQ